MVGVVRTPLVYTQFQYASETDEQFRERCRAIEEENRRADEIERAWAPGPMKGLGKWDCGCPVTPQSAECPHWGCPRRFLTR